MRLLEPLPTGTGYRTKLDVGSLCARDLCEKDALLTSSGMAVDVWLTGVSGTLIPAMPATFDVGYRWPTNGHARPPFLDQKSG
jgi:hypothetical protein